MNIAENFKKIKETLPTNVDLIAVSKFHTAESIMKLYDTGHRLYGESKMQELKAKHQELPSDIEWHFIGHLQRNKVKDIIQYTHTIHSIDSARLLAEIAKQAKLAQTKVCCLLQIHIAEEDTKYGFSAEECKELLEQAEDLAGEYAYIGGLMGMATYTEDRDQIRSEFRTLKMLFEELKLEYFKDDIRFSKISMGMSGDYDIAIEEGSTMVRIGTTIFGEREY